MSKDAENCRLSDLSKEISEKDLILWKINNKDALNYGYTASASHNSKWQHSIPLKMLASDAEDCPLSGKSKTESKQDLVFEKSIIEMSESRLHDNSEL